MARTLVLIASVALIACVPDPPASMDSGMADSPYEATFPEAGDAAASCGLRGLPCCNGMCSNGAECTSGNCTCPMGTTVCGPSCANLMVDSKNCGDCDHDCLGGGCGGGKCQPTTIVPGQATLSSLAVTSNSIFWSRSGAGMITAAIYKSALDGSNVVKLYDGGPSGACYGVSVDNNNVYFACASILYKCAINGCNMMPMALSTAFPSAIKSTAVDGNNGRLYFAVTTVYNQQGGGFVASVPTAGGANTRLVPGDQPNPTSIVIANGTVYWLNAGTVTSGTPNLNGSVKRAPLGVNQAETLIASDNTSNELWSLSVDTTTAYWANASLIQIRSAPLGGGAPATFVQQSAVYLDVTMVDGMYVYWGAGTGGSLYRCPKAGCVTPELLAGNQGVSVLAQDTTAIYWDGAGNIQRLAK